MSRIKIRLRYLNARLRSMQKESRSTSLELDELLAEMAEISQELQNLAARAQIHGPDIYIQPTKPETTEDYVWINTDVDDI
ncbi:MAG: hypothetical protein WCY84_00125 [Candidatus Cloacimonadaceae bacterium]